MTPALGHRKKMVVMFTNHILGIVIIHKPQKIVFLGTSEDNFLISPGDQIFEGRKQEPLCEWRQKKKNSKQQ